MDFELKSFFFGHWILILEPEKYTSLTGNHSNNLSLDSLGTKAHLTEAVIPIAKAHQECRHNESGSPALSPAFVYLTV